MLQQEAEMVVEEIRHFRFARITCSDSPPLHWSGGSLPCSPHAQRAGGHLRLRCAWGYREARADNDSWWAWCAPAPSPWQMASQMMPASCSINLSWIDHPVIKKTISTKAKLPKELLWGGGKEVNWFFKEIKMMNCVWKEHSTSLLSIPSWLSPKGVG